MYANGKLWGALDTALNSDGGAQRAGIAWYIVKPGRHGLARASRVQGYLGAAGLRLHLPGDRRHRQRSRRDGVHRHRRQRSTRAPPTRRSTRSPASVRGTSCPVARAGAAMTASRATSRRSANPPRTRWGDYGAAAVDGNSVWIASEYIAHACNYTDWGGGGFVGGTGPVGRCGDTRGALGNWSTRISQIAP